MADGPRPLSTIPPIPADGDFDAVCAALRQSGRGRWFLEEYARRNRNGNGPAPNGAVQISNGVIRDEHLPNPQMNVFALAERLQDLAWTMREHALDGAICEQIEALAAAILSASSLRDPSRVQKLGEALRHLEERIQGMIEAMAQRAATRPSTETATESEPDRAIRRGISRAAQPIATAHSMPKTSTNDRIIDVDEELFAGPLDTSAESPGVLSDLALRPRTAGPPSTSADDPLAALNAMSDEEKIALFT
jgi:hypothetical protein